MGNGQNICERRCGYIYDKYSRKQHSFGHWEQTGIPHSRQNSLALHSFYAIECGAEATIQSVLITMQAALTKLVPIEIREFLQYDEVHLETLRDPNQKQVIFLVASDTSSAFDFLNGLIVNQALHICCDKAFSQYNGEKLPRHVRFELGEFRNLGKMQSIGRAISVIRSRNMSLSLHIQALSQLNEVYGKDGAATIMDNCSTLLFLATQDKDTLEMMSARLGEKTVYSRIFTRSFSERGTNRTEQIQSVGRKVKDASQILVMPTRNILVFMCGIYGYEDRKYPVERHPLYTYINPTSPRSALQPPPRCLTNRLSLANIEKSYWKKKKERSEKSMGDKWSIA